MSFFDEVTTAEGKPVTFSTRKETSKSGGDFFSQISYEPNRIVTTQEPVPQPSLGSRISTGLKETIAQPITEQSFNPLKTIDTIFGSATDTLKDTKSRINEAINTQGESKLKVGADIASAGLGVVNTIFTPITSTLKGLESVPGVGYIATGVNRLFGAIGVVGGESAVSVLNSLPISDKSKQELEPVVNELGALVGQIVVGKIGGKGYDALSEKIKTNSQKVLDVVKEEAKTTIPGEIKPIEQIKELDIFSQVTDVTGKPVEFATKTESPQISEQISSPEIKTSGLAETLKKQSDAYSVENGVRVDFGDLPEYQTRPVKAQEAVDYVKSNPEDAFKVANGELPVPDGLLLGEVYSALKVKAIKEGDVATQLRLAKSKANEFAAQAGREVKAFDAGIIDDPIRAIREIMKVREEAIIRRTGNKNIKAETTKEFNKAKEIVKKEKIAPKTWDDFITSLEC